MSRWLALGQGIIGMDGTAYGFVALRATLLFPRISSVLSHTRKSNFLCS